MREARVRCPCDEREGQNRSRHRPTANMDHHSHPVIGASSGNSALLDITPRSSPKVLMAQTPNPLSAANEQYTPSFRQSFGEVQARLFSKKTTRSASTFLPHAPSHTIKCRPYRSDPEATVEHNPNLSNQPSTINHQPVSSQVQWQPQPLSAPL